MRVHATIDGGHVRHDGPNFPKHGEGLRHVAREAEFDGGPYATNSSNSTKHGKHDGPLRRCNFRHAEAEDRTDAKTNAADHERYAAIITGRPIC